MDETLCWTLYQASNWSNWSRPMRLAIQILPMVVFGIVAWRAFSSERPPLAPFLIWRDFRLFLILLIPWAVSKILGTIYYTLCYSP